MTTRRVVQPRDAANPTGFSPAIRSDDILYVSGQVARGEHMNVGGEGDAEAQTNYDAVGSENGAKARKARAAFIPDPPPASTGVLVAGLVGPRLQVEIEAVAVLEARWEEGTR